MRRLAALALCGVLMFTTPVYADCVTAQGEMIYDCTEGPYLAYTTGYYSENTHGSHGDRMHEGIAAMAPEFYGYAAIVYEAIPNDDGGYDLGDQLDIFEVKDTGYGYPTGFDEPSKIRPDKGSIGTIEAGLHIDVYYDNYSRCKKWMNKTKGYVFVQLLPDVKG